MNETMTMSEAINEIALALSKFQGSVKQPNLAKTVTVKTKTGGSYNFRYADLAECMRAAQKPLSENKLAVTQIVCAGCLRTMLLHESGQWIASNIQLGQSSDIQGYGSQLTYLKRYSYCAILGLVADDDEDGNAACGNKIQQMNGQPQTTGDANNDNLLNYALPQIEQAMTKDQLTAIYNNYPTLQNVAQFKTALTARRKKLGIKNANEQ